MTEKMDLPAASNVNESPSGCSHISIVVPVKDKLGFVVPVINALLDEVSRFGRAELIVVDNFSTDGAWEWLETRADRFRLFRAAGNVSVVRNFGAGQAKGTILLFVDADVLIRAGHLAHIESLFESGKADAYGCEYNIPDGAPWVEADWFHLTVNHADGYRAYLNAGNFAITRELFLRVGGFPESFETGEDTEICRRILGAQGKIFQSLRLDAVHLGNPKTLRGFFRRLRWHGMSAFEGKRLVLRHRSTQAALIYMLTVVIAGALALYGGIHAERLWLWCSVIVMLSVPLATYCYWTVRVKKCVSPVTSLILIQVMFLARISAIGAGILRYRQTRRSQV